MPPIETAPLRKRIRLSTVHRALKCTASTPAAAIFRTFAGLTPLPAITSIRPAAAATSVRIVSSPSGAVLRPPDVSTRRHPARTSASSASVQSRVMSKARWKVTSIPPASATRRAVRSSSTRPSGVSSPATTQSAPHSRAKRTSSSIWRNSSSV